MSVDLLRELLRTRTVNPPGDERSAVDVVEAYLAGAGLRTEVLVSPGGRPNLVARVEGPHDRPPLVLLSHSDVVPVEEEHWTHDPFGGELDDGFLWGRGALDMKGMVVMHAVAAAELARSGHTPAREVVVVVAADEESGGGEGAAWLVDAHPASVGLRDGGPAPEVLGEGAYGVVGMLSRPVLPIAVGEKTAVWLEIAAAGSPGHGALPPADQAPVNLAKLVSEIAGFGTPRVHPVMREQFATLATGTPGPAAAVFRALASGGGRLAARTLAPRLRQAGVVGLLLSDSITPTGLTAGYKTNVVPAEANASFDCRLLPDTDVEAFVASIARKAGRHGGSVVSATQKGHGPVSDRGPLFDLLVEASRRAVPDALLVPTLSPGITDVRYFRRRGAAGYGWCPLLLTPELLATIHGHDERVAVDDFARAVAATSELVSSAATREAGPGT